MHLFINFVTRLSIFINLEKNIYNFILFINNRQINMVYYMMLKTIINKLGLIKVILDEII